MDKSIFKSISSLFLCCAVALSITGCGSVSNTVEASVPASVSSAGTLMNSESVLSAPSQADMEKYQKQIFAMDTIMTLTAYGSHGEEALESAVTEIYALNNEFDPQIETSSIFAINKEAGKPVEVSETIADMIHTAKKVYDQTDGALDITILPVVELWGFLDADFHVPSDEQISKALELICFEDIEVTEDSGKYFVTIPADAAITLGAVAKGCTADIVLDTMADCGVTSGIVSLGGNIQTLGIKPDGKNWAVAIQDPNNTASYVGILNVGEIAVVTSGTYQRFFEENGHKYHHIVDPATGYPVENELLSMTILTEDGTLADCLSTAMFVLGTEKALDYWRTYGNVPGEEFEMILINKDNEVLCTSGLENCFTLVDNHYTLSFTD